MSVNYNQLDLSTLFDQKYGSLRGSFALSVKEYEEFKSWSLNSGFFQYQLVSQFENND